MNKRIEELIWECAIPAEQVIDYSKSNDMIKVTDHTLDVEKFAELIIQSIANIDFRMEIGLTSDQDMDIKNLIKNHFID